MSLSAFSHDIEVANADGVTIYYNYSSDGTELEVTYLGSKYNEYSNEYQGNVVIPASVTYSGKTYPVTSIGNFAFKLCTGLTSIEIPNSVTSVGSYVFDFCTRLTSVSLDCSSVNQWLREIKSIKEITFGKNVKSIDYAIFSGCTELTSIKVEDDNPKFDSRNNCSAIVETATNELIAGCKNTIIPNSVTSIGDYAFYGCTGLTSIEIPNSVTNIGDEAFYGCSRLTSIEIPNSVISIGERAFESCGELTSVNISDIEAWCKISFSSEWANPLCYVHHLYMNGSEIKELVIPESVTSIGQYAFQGCSGLTSIEIPNSVTSIGACAFGGCSNLESIDIPNSVTSIGESAFQYCSNLTSIEIPNSVTSIGRLAFYDCSRLTTVTIPGSVSGIGVSTFARCDRLKSVIIDDGVCYIAQAAFYECEQLESVVIPKSITSINYPFYGCKNLSSIIVDKDNPYYEGTALSDAVIEKDSRKLVIGCKNTIIPEGVTSIGISAFAGIGITKISIPSTVSSICESAFYSSPLDTLCIYSNMLSLTRESFGYCPLKDVFILGESLPYLIHPSDDVFYSSKLNNTLLHVHSNMIDYCENNEPWKSFGSIIGLPKHQVTYYIDGEELDSFDVEWGTDLSSNLIVSEPYREGFKFSGWSEIPATMPDYDIKVFGSFSINRYTLSYEVDGLEYKIDSIEYGKAIAPEEGPTKEGYTFSGWSEIPETMPAHDVTVTGSFTINKYKVTYMVDGVEYKVVDVEYGSAITPEAALTKEGYTFSGWTDLPETMPAHDVTVTGTFTINKYKVTYIVDGEEYGTSEVIYGAEVNPIEEPSKEGYTFSGWLDLPEEMPANDVTVTGTFTVNKYKVTFMYGDNVLTTIEVNYGEAIELPESLNSERYTLVEWKDVPDTMPAHDITIYADYVDGINTITADSKNEQYIRINGMYTNDMKRGVNIIRTQDGKTRKVWVK